jgi:anti-sigma factor RsiW
MTPWRKEQAMLPNKTTFPAGQHPDLPALRQFVNGTLDSATTIEVMQHMAECDACLEIVDRLWAEKPSALAVSADLDLDKQTARKIERKLLKRINRSNLGGSIVNFGIGGFANVLLAVIRPFLGSVQHNHTTGNNND